MSTVEHRNALEPYAPTQPAGTANLAEILERVLDKGIVIAGDITINLLEIELLTIKLRLLVASVDKAREMGIDWWEGDPALTTRGGKEAGIEDRLSRLEDAVGLPSPSKQDEHSDAPRDRRE
jgi:hypothetical protein